MTAPDGSRWHVNLVRANAWSPSAWSYRLNNAFSLLPPRGLGDDTDVLMHPLVTSPLHHGVPALYRWIVYRLHRRTDWRVVVRPATEILLTGAVIDRWYPDRRSAGAHAMELVRQIGSGRLVPSQAGPDDAPGRPPAV